MKILREPRMLATAGMVGLALILSSGCGSKEPVENIKVEVIKEDKKELIEEILQIGKKLTNPPGIEVNNNLVKVKLENLTIYYFDDGKGNVEMYRIDRDGVPNDVYIDIRDWPLSLKEKVNEDYQRLREIGIKRYLRK